MRFYQEASRGEAKLEVSSLPKEQIKSGGVDMLMNIWYQVFGERQLFRRTVPVEKFEKIPREAGESLMRYYNRWIRTETARISNAVRASILTSVHGSTHHCYDMTAIHEAIMMLLPHKKYEALTGTAATPQAHVPRRAGRLPFRRMPRPARAVQVSDIVGDGLSEIPEETNAEMAEADGDGQADDFGMDEVDGDETFYTEAEVLAICQARLL